MSINALTVVPKRRHRLRTALYATALLIGGGIIGAVVVGPTFGQGGDGPRWHRWSDTQQSQDEGPRWRRGRNEGQQDDSGWRRGFGQRFGGMRRDGDGPRSRGGDFAARMLYPGAIERRVNRVLGAVDASTEQRQKVRAIFETAAGDLHGLGQKRADNRRQIAQALTAETIDRGKIETLRADQVKLSDATSKRLTDALVEAAEVLTPAQRADLGRRFERQRRG
jgi:Spy/CpxP family protein refolding chaperone